MSDLRTAAQQALKALEREIDTRRCKVSTLRSMNALRAALAEPVQERNFCPRCGKRTNDIHTCTPPGGNDVHS